MQRLEVSGEVRLIHRSLGVKRLTARQVSTLERSGERKCLGKTNFTLQGINHEKDENKEIVDGNETILGHKAALSEQRLKNNLAV